MCVFIVLGFYFLRLRPAQVEARVVVFRATAAVWRCRTAAPAELSLLGPVSVVLVIPSVVHHS
jgi:hypothetical protein